MYYIKKEVNSSTTTGASDFKVRIKTAKLLDFDQHVKKFSIWFADTRSEIIKLEGNGRENKYICLIFKAYLTSRLRKECSSKENKRMTILFVT